MKDLREQLDLKQESLASYFGVQRSHYSLIELGLRQLPLGTVYRTGLLAHSAYAVQTDDLVYTAEEQAAIQAEWQKRHSELQRQIRISQRRLELLTKKIEKNLRKRQCAELMRRKLPDAPPTETETAKKLATLFIETCEAEAAIALHPKKLMEIERLKLALEMKQLELKKIETFINSQTPQ